MPILSLEIHGLEVLRVEMNVHIVDVSLLRRTLLDIQPVGQHFLPFRLVSLPDVFPKA